MIKDGYDLPDDLVLGKRVSYDGVYDKNLLQGVLRELNRNQLNLTAPYPFSGIDIWNGYEISWLDLKGKPIVMVGEFVIPASSKYLIESKSFKLYLNSFNQTKFASVDDVVKTLVEDLSKCANEEVMVKLISLASFHNVEFGRCDGICLDMLDIEVDSYEYDPNLLENVNKDQITETLYSDLLKSNCLITGQPDWGSVEISYTGPQIDHKQLLKYIISFRQHQEFHEQCVERIFIDLFTRCKCKSLSVSARYTRRGGLDINPCRTNLDSKNWDNIRLIRQ